MNDSKVVKLDFSVSKPMCVLMPNMGAGSMPDFDTLKKGFEEFGIDVISADLTQKDAIGSLPWDRIGVVDLSNMRGCLTSFDKYLGIIDRIQDHAKKGTKYSGVCTSIVPHLENIKWISSKASYLDYLNAKNIPIIPTLSLCRMQDPENADIIAQPDNIDLSLNEIHQYIHSSNTNNFVLKPSTSSLARGLVFIDYLENEKKYKITIPNEDSSNRESIYPSYQELSDNFLSPYLLNTASHDHSFLFQEYVPNIETSAVFINGTPHYVERTQGPNSSIAHARFGGTDTVIQNPDKKLVELTQQVMAALPMPIKNSYFLRVDVMKNLDTDEYILSEIEGAGAIRLWLNEANRVEDYIRMMVHCGLDIQPSSTHQQSPSYQDGFDLNEQTKILAHS